MSTDNSRSETELQSIPSTTALNSDAVIDVDLSKMDNEGTFKASLNRVPMTLVWKDVTWGVHFRPKRFAKKEYKEILHGISGYIQPGSNMAIMGPSGSGKTTFLNLLAGHSERFGGEILVNGKPRTKSFRAFSAFVQQDDVLMGNLTVRENLFFAAMLRLPSTMPRKEKLARIQATLIELGLLHCADTKVGIAGLVKGISGGERKRCSIGVELITNPSVLFLDEPTSGLDAKTSLNIMSTVINLSKSNRTVIFTIHQPRSDIYQLFDKVLLLSKGSVAYFGDANTSLDYFDAAGHSCPLRMNPADFLIDLITPGTSNGSQQENFILEKDNARITDLSNHYAKTTTIKEEIEGIVLSPDQKPLQEIHDVRVYNSNWFTQLAWITLRSFKNVVRDRMLTIARSVQTISMVVIVSIVFWQLGYDQPDIQARSGVVFFLLLNQSMSSILGVVRVFPQERPVLLRERASKTYHISTYFIGKALAEIPQVIFFPTILICIAYWTTGLNPGVDRFFIHLALILLMALVGQGVGLFLSASFPSEDSAMAIAPILILIFILFGGFYVQNDQIPKWIQWLKYISPFKYSYEILLKNEYDGATFNCGESTTRCLRTGQEVLDSMGMSNISMWENFVILIAMFFIYRILGYFSTRAVQKKRL